MGLRGEYSRTIRRAGHRWHTYDTAVQADIYSAALIGWYLLTGHRPAVDIRTDRTARPDLAVAKARWHPVGVLLESMWAADPEARPSAGVAASTLVALYDGPRPGSESGSCCVPS